MSDPTSLPELLSLLETLCASQQRRLALAHKRLTDCNTVIDTNCAECQRSVAALRDVGELASEIERLAGLAEDMLRAPLASVE